MTKSNKALGKKPPCSGCDLPNCQNFEHFRQALIEAVKKAEARCKDYQMDCKTTNSHMDLLCDWCLLAKELRISAGVD
jgi:hypothetical protein